MSLETLIDVFANRIPVVRSSNFLTRDECDKMLEIVKAHQLVSNTFTTISALLTWAGSSNKP